MEPPREVLHTRFRCAPTGGCHLGHVIIAWFNMVAAWVSDGTFLMRLQELKATLEPGRWEQYRRYAHENLQDLIDIGIKPSPADAFLRYGMDPSWGLQLFEDKATVDYWYKQLGLEEVWGPWQVADMGNGAGTAWAWKQCISGNYEQGFEHPYIILTQIALDMAYKRNCLIRGADHLTGSSLAHHFAQQIAHKLHGLKEPDRTVQYVPTFHFLPRVKRSGNLLIPELRAPDGVSLASSNPRVTEGFYARNIKEAKLSPADLFDFLERQVFVGEDGRRAFHRLWGETQLRTRITGDLVPNVYTPAPVGSRWGVMEILTQVKPEIIISDYEWYDLLGASEKGMQANA